MKNKKIKMVFAFTFAFAFGGGSLFGSMKQSSGNKPGDKAGLVSQADKKDEKTAEKFANQSIPLNYYGTPGPEYGKLAVQSLHFIWLMPLGVTSIALMPSNFTSWNDTFSNIENPGAAWTANVRAGPVIDKDNFVFNYVIHPYLGASIYMMAMNHGLPWWQSFLYVTFISTFWEYVPEAVFEIPSLNDMIVTPVLGALLGTSFYFIQASILRNNREVLNSRFLGGLCLFVVNPLGSFIDFIQGDHPGDGMVIDSSLSPVLTNSETVLYWRINARY